MFMKKLLVYGVVAFALFFSSAYAQDTTAVTTSLFTAPQVETTVKPKKQFNLSNRASDHFLLQIGYTNWSGTPDSINVKGFSRSLNAYFMFDFPFKSTPKISAAAGLGIGSDHIFFDKNVANVKGQTKTLRFLRTPDTTFFKKSKLVTTYLEAPIELRYTANPENYNNSFKMALGVKVGYLIKAGTRSRTLRSDKVSSINDYRVKESDKRYFNSTRIIGTARIGYGPFSIYGSYQFTNLLKDAVGPQLHPFTIGLTISGL